MNTPQQVEAVKAIIKFKNRILHINDWDEIAGLVQSAVDTASVVPANGALDTFDKTKSKEWNIAAVKSLLKNIKDRVFSSLDVAYPIIATSLLSLATVFVKGGIEGVNKILADSFLKKNLFESAKEKN